MNNLRGTCQSDNESNLCYIFPLVILGYIAYLIYDKHKHLRDD